MTSNSKCAGCETYQHVFQMIEIEVVFVDLFESCLSSEYGIIFFAID